MNCEKEKNHKKPFRSLIKSSALSGHYRDADFKIAPKVD